LEYGAGYASAYNTAPALLICSPQLVELRRGMKHPNISASLSEITPTSTRIDQGFDSNDSASMSQLHIDVDALWLHVELL